MSIQKLVDGYLCLINVRSSSDQGPTWPWRCWSKQFGWISFISELEMALISVQDFEMSTQKLLSWYLMSQNLRVVLKNKLYNKCCKSIPFLGITLGMWYLSSELEKFVLIKVKYIPWDVYPNKSGWISDTEWEGKVLSMVQKYHEISTKKCWLDIFVSNFGG